MTLGLAIMINKLYVSVALETYYRSSQVCPIYLRIHRILKWSSTRYASVFVGVYCLKQRAGTADFAR